MHHHHFHRLLREPSPLSVAQDELYYFASVEVTANEFGVEREFFEGLDVDGGGFHEGVAYCGDAVEDLFGGGGSGTGAGADEVDVRVGALGALVEALEAEGHYGFRD